MKKVLSFLIATLSVVMLSANVYAATPTVPLANITVYQLLTNVGYSIDTSRPAAMTPDGCPIYGTGLPLKSLIQSNEFANTLVISDRNGSKILGIRLFFDAQGGKNNIAPVIAKFIKALDENIYNEMGADWVNEEIMNFLDSFNRKAKEISLKSMNKWYKFSGKINRGVFTVNITAEAK